MKPLEDVRVLDLTHAHAGPMCTMFLADMGAEVIKIEPSWGEMTRFFPPLINDMSPYFLYLNRGKRGLTLNLKSEKGIKIFKDLVRLGDVVVENFSPGTMDKLGIGYEILRELNPKIIFASISGFGQYGPYSQRLSFDPIAQASSGYVELTRLKFDPDGPPIYPPEAIADTIPALLCLIGILSALHHRETTGRGQMIDVAQMDSMIGVLPSITFHTLAKTTFSNALKNYVLPVREIYKAKNGYIVVTVPREMLDRVAKVLGLDQQMVNSLAVEKWVSEKTVDEAVELLVKARLPVAPVFEVEEVINNPQTLVREMIVETSHPVAGKVKMPGFPIKFSETPIIIGGPAPILGQDNKEILSTLLGLGEEKIKRLKEEGVI